MPPRLNKEPSHFEILGLTPKSLDGQDQPTQTKAVKQAYRRALLKHHPDKNQQARKAEAPGSPSPASPTSRKQESVHFTVDQITTAYTVLSDSRQRREYTRTLKSSTTNASSSATTTASSSSKSTTKQNPQQQQFHTQKQDSAASGVETVDLDDLAFDARRQVYYRSCRCGAARGYCFRELDLDEVGEDGELMVECTGCSLWLRVLFEEVEDDDGEDRGGGATKEVKQSGSGGSASKKEEGSRSLSTSSQGKSGGWSWKLNFGISIGGSASAGASSGKA